MNGSNDWFERIEFSYSTSDGEIVTGAIEQLGGLQRDRVIEAFMDFMRLAGFAMPEVPIDSVCGYDPEEGY